MPLAGIRAPTHDGNVRLIVHGVISDVRHPDRNRIMGINSMFRLRSGWAAHGFYGMIGAERLRAICAAAFDPIADGESAAAFDRGARRIAGIVLDGHLRGSTEDEEVFWSALTRLGAALDMEVPPLERLRTEVLHSAADHTRERVSA